MSCTATRLLAVAGVVIALAVPASVASAAASLSGSVNADRAVANYCKVSISAKGLTAGTAYTVTMRSSQPAELPGLAGGTAGSKGLLTINYAASSLLFGKGVWGTGQTVSAEITVAATGVSVSPITALTNRC